MLGEAFISISLLLGAEQFGKVALLQILQLNPLAPGPLNHLGHLAGIDAPRQVAELGEQRHCRALDHLSRRGDELQVDAEAALIDLLVEHPHLAFGRALLAEQPHTATDGMFNHDILSAVGVDARLLVK